MKPDSVSPTSICILHPIYAMILCFVDGCPIKEAVVKASNYLGIGKKEIMNIILPLIENKKIIKGYESIFPKDFLIEYKSGMERRKYNPDDFHCSNLNLKLSRLKAPADIICNITMKCYTDCVYCYADRNGHLNYKMSPDKICNIIDEAYNLGVVSFKLIGGDIFQYKEWEIILEKLKSYGYNPCLSTKYPLKEKDVCKLKEILDDKIPLQISLDTLISKNVQSILHVRGEQYKDDIISFIELLEKYEFNYIIHTVLNVYNDSLEDIKSIEDHIINRKFLREWFIDSAKCSMYLPYDYSYYKPSKENVIKIASYLENLSKSINSFKIHIPKIVKNLNKIDQEKKSKIFNSRVSCSGNVSSMYILPDGKVTICEELYWHPHFIIGDLNLNSIEEIWNSPKAHSLFYLNQSDISKDSPCSVCKDFKDCHSYKHVCWRDVILAYGSNNWDFPDPFCPLAPPILKDISME
jgi:radical SAM protein with 4Fe4S-binding SPASM domain